MKTINYDEASSSELDTEVDTSIYDHDIIDIKQQIRI